MGDACYAFLVSAGAHLCGVLTVYACTAATNTLLQASVDKADCPKTRDARKGWQAICEHLPQVLAEPTCQGVICFLSSCTQPVAEAMASSHKLKLPVG